MPIRDLRFSSASEAFREKGLLGWTAFSWGPFRFDGIAVRRTLRGQLALSFPSRRDRAGRAHFLVRPTDDDSRRRIEAEVFEVLGLEESGLG